MAGQRQTSPRNRTSRASSLFDAETPAFDSARRDQDVLNFPPAATSTTSSSAAGVAAGGAPRRASYAAAPSQIRYPPRPTYVPYAFEGPEARRDMDGDPPAVPPKEFEGERRPSTSFPPRINRKPVVRSSTAESSSSTAATAVERRQSASFSVRTQLRAPNSTGNLFTQASNSLSNLADDVQTLGMQEDVQEPPPYTLPPRSPLRDTKRPYSSLSLQVPLDSNSMFQMISNNHFEAVQKMIEGGVDLDEIDPETGRTAIMHAANLRRAQICHMLLNAGCRLHLKDFQQNTALHFAASQGDVEICRLLLERGAQLDEYNRDGKTPISLAARAGHLEAVDCLLNCWTSLNGHATALINGFLEATKGGNVATARAFIDRGVKPKKIKDSWKPVAYAAISGSVPMIDLLVAHRCNLKDRSPTGWTALHQAAFHGQTAMVLKLLEWKLSWKAQTKKDQETPLHLAIRANNPATAIELIRHKDASVTMTDVDSQQPLHHAVRRGDILLTTALLGKNAKLDAQNAFGWTPMLIAAAYGHGALVADFLIRGVSTEEKLGYPDNKPAKKTNEAATKGYWAEIRWPHAGARPLHVAIEFGNDDVANMLIAHGCKLDEPDSKSWRPIHYAAFHGRLAIVQLLLQRGVSPHSTTSEGNTPLALGFRERGMMPNHEEKEQICALLQAAAYARRKSKLSQLSGFMSSGNKSRDAGERNKAWHLAELAEALYLSSPEGDDESTLQLTPTSSSMIGLDADDESVEDLTVQASSSRTSK